MLDDACTKEEIKKETIRQKFTAFELFCAFEIFNQNNTSLDTKLSVACDG